MNNIWIDDWRVLAREARFDRFAKHDEEVRVSGCGVGKDGTFTSVVLTHGAGVKNVRVGKNEEEERVVVEEKIVKVGLVDVKVEKRRKKISQKKLKIKKEKNVKAEGEVGKKEEPRVKEGVKEDEGKKTWLPKVSKLEEKVGNRCPLLYNSKPEDRVWASGGMVATVVSGDSSLSLQQRVEDAGFANVVIRWLNMIYGFAYLSLLMTMEK